MENQQLEETLEDLSILIQNTFPNEYSYINYGGCVYFAYYLSKELEKRNIKFKVELIYSSKSLVDIYRSDAAALNKLKVPSLENNTNHVVINIGNKSYDSEGALSSSRRSIYGEVSNKHEWISKQLHNFYKNNKWNTSFTYKFDKDKRKLLRKLITDSFKQYDKKVKMCSGSR